MPRETISLQSPEWCAIFADFQELVNHYTTTLWRDSVCSSPVNSSKLCSFIMDQSRMRFACQQTPQRFPITTSTWLFLLDGHKHCHCLALRNVLLLLMPSLIVSHITFSFLCQHVSRYDAVWGLSPSFNAFQLRCIQTCLLLAYSFPAILYRGWATFLLLRRGLH